MTSERSKRRDFLSLIFIAKSTTIVIIIIIIIIIIIEKIKRELRQKNDTVFSLNQCHLLSEN